MTDSLHLALPLIAAAQAQKHVTHNEALRSLDALVMLSIEDRDLSAPPGTPTEGARYLVKATGTSAFAGKDGKIAHFRDGAWSFHTVRKGWMAYVADEDALILFDGSVWRPLLGTAAELQNVALFGLATTADATNPLSARLNSALFAAKTVANGGDGDLRWKLSKESAADTASLLFQDNFSGRAEIGLAGDDDLHFKVSADGSAWTEALRIARATGRVSFPAQGMREVLTANRTYYVRTDGSDANDGLTDNSGGAFLTIQKAIDVVAALDIATFTVTIQLADGTYTAGGVITGPWVGSGTVRIDGNSGTPGNVIVSVTGGTCFYARNGARVTLRHMELRTTTSGDCLLSEQASAITFTNLRFGTCARAHVFGNGGAIQASGNYAIVGNAQYHIWCRTTTVVTDFRTVTLTGTPAFSGNYAYVANAGILLAGGQTFSGSATGARYYVETNGVIATAGGGASYLPGNAAGSTATGGQYA